MSGEKVDFATLREMLKNRPKKATMTLWQLASPNLSDKYEKFFKNFEARFGELETDYDEITKYVLGRCHECQVVYQDHGDPCTFLDCDLIFIRKKLLGVPSQ